MRAENPSGQTIVWRVARAAGRLAGAGAARLRRAKRKLKMAVLYGMRFREPETKLIRDSQSYWNESADQLLRQNSHWRGMGIFADEERWLALGRDHLRLYEKFAQAAQQKTPLRRVVEWGCGGGMNAIHFGGLAAEFCGIDISAASLAECGRQMQAAGLQNFRPILIDAGAPERAVDAIGGPCDLVISTYVFEALPSPEYGLRVLRVIHQLLAYGGCAMIQVKYREAGLWTASRSWAYAKNLAWTATYRIEEFWQAAVQCGFTPTMITLVPEQPFLKDRNYAYFFLQKEPGTHVSGTEMDGATGQAQRG